MSPVTCTDKTPAAGAPAFSMDDGATSSSMTRTDTYLRMQTGTSSRCIRAPPLGLPSPPSPFVYTDQFRLRCSSETARSVSNFTMSEASAIRFQASRTEPKCVRGFDPQHFLFMFSTTRRSRIQILVVKSYKYQLTTPGRPHRIGFEYRIAAKACTSSTASPPQFG